MLSYIIQRILAMVLMLFGVSLLVFGIMELAPGGPEGIFVAQTMDLQLMAQIRHSFGLDQPASTRYVKWLWAAAHGDFGRSLTTTGQNVSDMIAERLGATILLTATSLIVATVVSLLLGVLNGVYRYSWLDHIMTLYAYFGMSFPTFWFGIMLIWLFSITLGWLPSSGMSEYGREWNIPSRIAHLALPMITLAGIWTGIFVRFLRASIIDVLHQDFIRTARSKGLPQRRVLFRHALRNALIPFVTVVGFEIPSLIAGSVFVEMIFAWPGVGRLTVQALYRRDYPVIMGVCIVIAFTVILTNLLVDLAYPIIDPRITYE
jgi:peptide/nickel transport system permease protein